MRASLYDELILLCVVFVANERNQHSKQQGIRNCETIHDKHNLQYVLSQLSRFVVVCWSQDYWPIWTIWPIHDIRWPIWPMTTDPPIVSSDALSLKKGPLAYSLQD